MDDITCRPGMLANQKFPEKQLANQKTAGTFSLPPTQGSSRPPVRSRRRVATADAALAATFYRRRPSFATKLQKTERGLFRCGEVVRNHTRSPAAPGYADALSTNHNFIALGMATTLKVREATVLVPLRGYGVREGSVRRGSNRLSPAHFSRLTPIWRG